MPKDKYVVLSEAIEQLECAPSEVRRMIEDGDLDGRRDDPTGPLLVSQKSIDDYLERDEDDEDEGADDFEAGYNQGWEDATAERESDEE